MPRIPSSSGLPKELTLKSFRYGSIYQAEFMHEQPSHEGESEPAFVRLMLHPDDKLLYPSDNRIVIEVHTRHGSIDPSQPPENQGNYGYGIHGDVRDNLHCFELLTNRFRYHTYWPFITHTLYQSGSVGKIDAYKTYTPDAKGHLDGEEPTSPPQKFEEAKSFFLALLEAVKLDAVIDRDKEKIQALITQAKSVLTQGN